jgi:hypothetical protein
VEISKGCVSIIDNSGNHFDMFNPPSGIQLRGGGKTARVFEQIYHEQYNYTYRIDLNESIQTFTFMNSLDGSACVWSVKNILQIWEYSRGTPFIIPNDCKEYRVEIPHGAIDLSTVYVFLDSIVSCSQKTDKEVVIKIHDSDKLKGEFIEALADCTNRKGKNKVRIE